MPKQSLLPLYWWFPERNPGQRPRVQQLYLRRKKAKNVTYTKREIFHPDSWDHHYYVCETTTDKQARKLGL